MLYTLKTVANIIKATVAVKISTEGKDFDFTSHLSLCQALKLITIKTATKEIMGMETVSNRASNTLFNEIFSREIKIKPAKYKKLKQLNRRERFFFITLKLNN